MDPRTTATILLGLAALTAMLPHAGAIGLPADELPRTDVQAGAHLGNTTAYANAVQAAAETEVHETGELVNDLARDPSAARAEKGARDASSRTSEVFYRTLRAVPGLFGDASDTIASTAREVGGELGEPVAAAAGAARDIAVGAYELARDLPRQAYTLVVQTAAYAQALASWGIDTVRSLVP